MTGAYVRIKRDGKYRDVEIEELTDAERSEFFKDRDRDELLRWINVLCNAMPSFDDLDGG